MAAEHGLASAGSRSGSSRCSGICSEQQERTGPAAGARHRNVQIVVRHGAVCLADVAAEGRVDVAAAAVLSGAGKSVSRSRSSRSSSTSNTSYTSTYLVHGADELARDLVDLGDVVVTGLDPHRAAGQVELPCVFSHILGAAAVVDLDAVEALFGEPLSKETSKEVSEEVSEEMSEGEESAPSRPSRNALGR